MASVVNQVKVATFQFGIFHQQCLDEQPPTRFRRKHVEENVSAWESGDLDLQRMSTQMTPLDCVRNCDLGTLEATGPRSFQGDAFHKKFSHVRYRLQIRFILPCNTPLLKRGVRVHNLVVPSSCGVRARPRERIKFEGDCIPSVTSRTWNSG